MHAGELAHPGRQRVARAKRGLPAAADDLRAEPHHETHAEPRRAARIVRARDDVLQTLEGQVVLARPLPADDVHVHVAVRIERRAGGLRAPVDPRQLVGRITRAVDVQKEHAWVGGGRLAEHAKFQELDR